MGLKILREYPDEYHPDAPDGYHPDALDGYHPDALDVDLAGVGPSEHFSKICQHFFTWHLKSSSHFVDSAFLRKLQNIIYIIYFVHRQYSIKHK